MHLNCYLSGVDGFSSFSNTTVAQVLKLLEEVKETQRVHTGILNSLLKTVNSVAEHAELPDDIEFPLKTTDDRNKLEENLKDKTIRNQLVSKLIVLWKCIDSVSSCSSSTDIRYRKLLMGLKIN